MLSSKPKLNQTARMAFISRMVRYEEHDFEVMDAQTNYRTLLINQKFLNSLFNNPEVISNDKSPSILMSEWSTVIDIYWRGMQIVTYCDGGDFKFAATLLKLANYTSISLAVHQHEPMNSLARWTQICRVLKNKKSLKKISLSTPSQVVDLFLDTLGDKIHKLQLYGKFSPLVLKSGIEHFELCSIYGQSSSPYLYQLLQLKLKKLHISCYNWLSLFDLHKSGPFELNNEIEEIQMPINLDSNFYLEHKNFEGNWMEKSLSIFKKSLNSLKQLNPNGLRLSLTCERPQEMEFETTDEAIQKHNDFVRLFCELIDYGEKLNIKLDVYTIQWVKLVLRNNPSSQASREFRHKLIKALELKRYSKTRQSYQVPFEYKNVKAMFYYYFHESDYQVFNNGYDGFDDGEENNNELLPDWF